jgi:hypothetical protein
MKTVMLHMKMPDDLAEACEGKDLKAEVSAALRARWFQTMRVTLSEVGTFPSGESLEEMIVTGDVYPTYGSIPAETKR